MLTSSPAARPRERWSAKARGFELALEPTPDVLAGLAAERTPGQTLVGFAAEHGGEFVQRARRKLERKGLDAIVVNDVSDPAIGFDSDDNQVTFVEPEAESLFPTRRKAEVAEAILDQINGLRRDAEAEVGPEWSRTQNRAA